MYSTTHITAITDVPASQWNALTPDDNPFIKHEFLASLEVSQSVTAEHGWQPWHLLIYDNKTLVAAAPLYIKNHSYGEFVFDFSWADAYAEHGFDYYPKLVNAIAFTPVTGPRLLARDETAYRALIQALQDCLDDGKFSSWHSLFISPEDHKHLADAGISLRQDCHYRWHNRNYADFDDFLSHLSSKRRKEIRRERRRVAKSGVTITRVGAADVTPQLQSQLYAFYVRTYHVRGQLPYLTPVFFDELHQQLPEQVFYFVAWQHQQPVAMAFMLETDNALYGRHWGCLADQDSLHFETCYYAGIEYAIAQGKQFFDAGAQGEHKLRRGFEPFTTWSAHYLAHPGFAAAVEDFVQREGAAVQALHARQRQHSSFPNAADTAPAGDKISP